MDIEPTRFPRRVLLAVVGLTPQVVTETLFGLVRRRPRFDPTELRLITTGEGAARIRCQLLATPGGAFAEFARDHAPALGPVLDATRIDVLDDAAGAPLRDIASAAEAARAADRIVDIVRDATAIADAAIWASIAGGRKTMGFLLGHAMSLFGRPQDRLSHVLVNPPFQDHPDFFFPPRRPRRIASLRDGERLDTRAARIVLAELPLLRLRDGLPNGLLSGRAGYAETIAQAQQAMTAARLDLHPTLMRVRLGDVTRTLPPVDFAFLLWMARRRLDGLPAVSWRDAQIGEFLAAHARVARSDGARDRVARTLREGMPRDWFEQRVSRVNKLVDDALGPVSAAYRITKSGHRPISRYGLPHRLEIRIADAVDGDADHG
jgi:CRISPR-associated protein (TIGR02584 family)